MAKVDVWLIVGTRRWARIMAAELCAAVPAECAIRLLGNPPEAGLRQWLDSSGLARRIQIVESMPPCPPSQTGVALVVNSAYQHRVSIEEALSAGYNVVSEKPMSFSREETQGLIDRAETLGLALFCTNTYLFAEYLSAFKDNWLTGRQFTAVYISWSDAATEVRYGESKGYDSGVPVIFDVLPHIANLVVATQGEGTPVFADIAVCGGGSEVSIRYRHEKIDIHVYIARNAAQRIRRMRFTGPDSNVVLDFTAEPGTVVVDQSPPVSVAPDWQKKRKPIAAMLRSVIEFFESGKQDTRLSTRSALLGNALIDGVVRSYVDQQLALLAGRGGREASSPDEDFDYAEKELRSVADRVLPHVAPDSPLRNLARAAFPTVTSNLTH